jgi:hypothetical protein
MPTAFALASVHSHLAVAPELYITILQLVAALLAFSAATSHGRAKAFKEAKGT